MNDAGTVREPSELAQPGAVRAPATAHASTLWAFTATTFLSAVLLFSVQPMFAKMVLPVLGGSPSVWAVAMCFFQAALLVGYCYAHLLTRLLPLNRTGYAHLALCLAAFVVLPIAVPAGFGEPPAGEPYLWQLGLFAVAVGLPFVAVAANAPLTQKWFSATGHPHGNDPYFLYAASNLGSLLSLLAYPFVLEPAFGVSALSWLWTLGYAALIAALAGIFAIVRRANPTAAAAPVAPAPAIDAPAWRQRLGWIGLALVPSALLTAFTTHVTTDVASAPLLWVLPLALYLLTFVLVFRERSLIPRRLLLAIHLAAVVAALLVLSQTRHEGWFVTAPVGTLVFFASAMVAHRTLYEQRPAAQHLTEFYLWMSLGGALGGLAAALIAPKLFSEVFEYPLLLALSMACRPGALSFRGRAPDEWMALWLIFAGGLLAAWWAPWVVANIHAPHGEWAAYQEASKAWLWFMWPLDQLRALWRAAYGWGGAAIVAAIMAAVLLANWRHPVRQALAALMMVLAITWLPSGVKRGEAQRSYFGVYRVMLSIDGQYNILIHGTTLHGAQRVRNEAGETVADISPVTYYHEKSPMAQTVVTRREAIKAQGDRKGRYGVIGLGTGSLACHGAEGELWRIFEIDPVVVGIARDSGNFTFIENCQPNPDIVLGDARLTMAREPDASFDLIVVDAFSSDAIPVHLMTAEALRLYMAKVADDGVVLLHISNRYLDLDSVLAATLPLLPGVQGVILSDDASDGSYASSTSTVALFARSEAVLEPYRKIAEVQEFATHGVKPWTDDTSDILRPFLSKYRKRF